jgi:hypothetical protein
VHATAAEFNPIVHHRWRPHSCRRRRLAVFLEELIVSRHHLDTIADRTSHALNVSAHVRRVDHIDDRVVSARPQALAILCRSVSGIDIVRV